MSDYKDDYTDEPTEQEMADAELSDDELEDVAGGVTDWGPDADGSDWSPEW